MTLEENRALVRREQEEIWNHTGNLDAAEELFAPEHAEAARQGRPSSVKASRTW